MESYTATETLRSIFGDFGEETPAALAIIAASCFGLAFLARRLGVRGPKPWFLIWLFTAVVGQIAMIQGRALSGYLFLAGVGGSYACLMLAIRRSFSIPEEVPK